MQPRAQAEGRRDVTVAGGLSPGTLIGGPAAGACPRYHSRPPLAGGYCCALLGFFSPLLFTVFLRHWRLLAATRAARREAGRCLSPCSAGSSPGLAGREYRGVVRWGHPALPSGRGAPRQLGFPLCFPGSSPGLASQAIRALQYAQLAVPRCHVGAWASGGPWEEACQSRWVFVYSCTFSMYFCPRQKVKRAGGHC